MSPVEFSRIGSYEVVRPLGVGGFATVYLALDSALNDEVAVKVLAADKAADPDFRQRFLDEARLMRRLANPGLIVVYHVDEMEGRPYFAMEYCSRGTLETRLAKLGRPLTLNEALDLPER